MRPLRLYQVGNRKELIWARDPIEARDRYIVERRKTDVYRMHYARSQIRVHQVPQAPLFSKPHVCEPILVLPNPNIVVTPHAKRETKLVAGDGTSPAPEGVQKTPRRKVGSPRRVGGNTSGKGWRSGDRV